VGEGRGDSRKSSVADPDPNPEPLFRGMDPVSDTGLDPDPDPGLDPDPSIIMQK